ncbi:aspartate/glutamate racemase family protein [Robiginitalea marina]|uniref:Aspartate/glutamate racemase family protein n=1 Tax=Robiginitalea marina TaxID=2954105 RepID=A0ABT1AW45_9FLAO|nr:aspartate/glutamate racemase family protein [Robiginitalea marina]
MKTIGFIGGMSWESSLEYYRIANEKVRELLGGFASCRCLMYSVDFAQVESLQHAGDWHALDALMADAAKRLYRGGADLIVLCTNTMHLCAGAIRAATPLPLLHIAEATGQRIASRNLKTAGLLGTKFTMEQDFYKSVLKTHYGIKTLIPGPDERQAIHDIIYGELVHGVIRKTSRETFKSIIHNLQGQGAEGIILGCTEIPLLVSQADANLPLFDTTRIHAEEAVFLALNSEP